MGLPPNAPHPEGTIDPDKSSEVGFVVTVEAGSRLNRIADGKSMSKSTPFLLGAVFKDRFLPAIKGDVVVFSFSCGVVAKFFFITLLKQVEIEGDFLGELENVLKVLVAIAP